MSKPSVFEIFFGQSEHVGRFCRKLCDGFATWMVMATENNVWSEKVVIDKSGANLAGLQNMNWLLLLQAWFWRIEILQVKYLNNMIELDHRFLKKLTRPMKGFQSFQSASATLDGIEVGHMIRKRQFPTSGQSAFQQFAALAAKLCPAIAVSVTFPKVCDRTRSPADDADVVLATHSEIRAAAPSSSQSSSSSSRWNASSPI
ncbi:hypothetical protein J2Z75_001305 [Rhizobium herbae]|uniref:DDE domain-containing protein n=1 Tax=Rhizobium herbae TaxID=508661 RepID=A0ABS4EIN1_9HYPH|nr:hypothetical protein [Rhizobium herbae]